jgi:hypothetical protein
MDRFDCTFSHGIARLQWSMFILYSSLVIICMYALPIVWIGFMVFNATINNISVISWRSILLVE